ncbi:MAG: FtsX-like permease family protein [Thermodesulfobacteriota bacterium]|nr:FtsX-like permease family protein [Thermodesulfobacteriota bacterium]
MLKILKFAVNNIAANKNRTLITLAVIIIGLCSINIGKGLMDGLQKESELGVTQGRTGEIQIHKQGYFDASEFTMLNYSIDGYSQLQDELKRIEGIEHLAGRIQFGGLLAKGDEIAVVVFCRAADIVNEVKVCPRIKENIIEGRFLTKDDTSGAVVANGLRKGIGASVGDLIIIVANTKDGFQNAVELEVVGIIEEKAAQANTRLVYLPIGKAQELLYMDDEVTEIVIKANEKSKLDALSERLNQLIQIKGLESNTWKDVATFFVDIMKKQNAVVFILCLIFYIIVIASITNTMMLTLFERKKEIGTLMAIGIKAKDVILLIVMEGTIIGVIGSLLGVLLSAIIIIILSKVGWTRSLPQTNILVTIYPFIDAPFMLLSLVLGVLSSILASIYPARKVLQVNPVDALRTI